MQLRFDYIRRLITVWLAHGGNRKKSWPHWNPCYGEMAIINWLISSPSLKNVVVRYRSPPMAACWLAMRCRSSRPAQRAHLGSNPAFSSAGNRIAMGRTASANLKNCIEFILDVTDC
ncbi:hypothetical protein [Aeromonas veronii]|uniref:hypothetical protein n=1 Tax=Aeromonas veronii TaxID=654 RepID=UPI003D1B6654